MIGTITRRMRAARSDMFKDLYTRSDFEHILDKLRDSSKSQRPSVCAELCNMFKDINVPCEINRDDDYYEKLIKESKLSDFVDVETRIIESMYRNFEKYPTPSEYMQKIVNKLSANDGWENDPLRLRILKRFIKYGKCTRYPDDLGNGEKRGKKNEIEKYCEEKYGNTIDSMDELAEIVDDGIFEHYFSVLESYKEKKDIALKVQNILKDADKVLKKNNVKSSVLSGSDKKENKHKELNELLSLYVLYHVLNAGYSYRKDKALINECYKDIFDNIDVDSYYSNADFEVLLKNIEKIKAQYEELRDKSEMKEDDIEKIVFEKGMLNVSKKYVQTVNEKYDEISKCNGKYSTYGLLKLCNDLAEGIFRTNGTTKKNLYYFAMVYNMTYYVKDSDSDMIIDYDTDIEKNLFEDYYNNNLMRFITSTFSENLSAYELDPSGNGINYKNFAEMIYLYYISSDYEPHEKIKRANEMIERVKVKKSNGSVFSNSNNNDLTSYFTSLFTEDIINWDEEEFEKFIKNNYDCSTKLEDTDESGKVKKYSIGFMQVQNKQKTAFDIYREIIEIIKEKYNAMRDTKKEKLDEEGVLEECNYGLWFTDLAASKKFENSKLEQIIDNIEDDLPEEEKKRKKTDFIKLLNGINRFVGYSKHVENINTKDFPDFENGIYPKAEEVSENINFSEIVRTLDVKKPENMSRTALITAYYYYYNLMNDYDVDDNNSKSFIDVYNDYTNSAMEFGMIKGDYLISLNSILEEAHYQPISERNIFDLAIIFSSYSYVHD